MRAYWFVLHAPPSRDSAAGVGAVAAKQGAYDDAIRTKRNTLILTLMNLFGGMAPGAVKRLRELAARSAYVDRTQYESWAAPSFIPYWAQRVRSASLRQWLPLTRAAACAASRASKCARPTRPRTPVRAPLTAPVRAPHPRATRKREAP